MKISIPPPVVAAVVLLIVLLFGFLTWRAVAPRASGGNYTPGLPPWMDPKEKASAGAATEAPTGSPNETSATNGAPAPAGSPGGAPASAGAAGGQK